MISTGKGVKETIESILIAFILAFVFRAFVVEAFVIPTGSMATTLLGAHLRYTCKECGYQFDVDFRSDGNPDEIDIPARATGRSFGAYCPNCRYKVAYAEANEPMVRYGDRILVLKYLYLLEGPQRWDVVVFKTPDQRSDSKVPLYTTNYIKRLVGLPGEHIMILDGDVYVWDRNVPWQPDTSMRDVRHWKIQKKPDRAQEAMWRIIYNNDYRPLHEERPTNMQKPNELRPASELTERWTLPWVAAGGSGWDTGDKDHSRVFLFSNSTGKGRLKFDPTTVPSYDAYRLPGGYFNDWMGYDAPEQHRPESYLNPSSYDPLSIVSDFKLSFFYERKKGDGPLKASLSKHDHEFVLEILGDRMRLLHRLPDKSEKEIPAVETINPSSLSGPIHVEFSNVDYHVTVRINDRIAFETNADSKSQAYYQPDLVELWDRFVRRSKDDYKVPSVWMEAERQEARISHISLWRDVYYTHQGLRGKPEAPAEVSPTEYFVLGDNSVASSDARMWENKVDLPEEDLTADPGRVPARFMLGRAFFVYWPAGYRPMESMPALVPDFGDMRLIH